MVTARRRRTLCGMTEQQNAATFRRWFDEGCSQGNVDLADELYSPEYVTHSVGPQFSPTLDGLNMFIRALRTGIGCHGEPDRAVSGARRSLRDREERRVAHRAPRAGARRPYRDGGGSSGGGE